VRAHGLVDEIPEARPSDHMCWVYQDDAAFDDAVREFLAGGLARGERLICVGDRVIAAVRAAAAPFEGVDELVSRGALEMLTLAEAYEATRVFVPEEQFAFYEAATRRAREDGYQGLRVLAEVSGLAADPAHREELVRWEHLADDYAVHGAGFSAMCAYRADLPPEALADVASVHPLVRAPDGLPSFRVFFEEDRLVLRGSVDAVGAGRLAQILGSSPVSSDRVLLDVAPLEFIDIAGCRVLARWARDLRERSVAVEVTGSSALLRRMWQVLDLHHVAPVDFTEARS
jgi:ABC-type transporter Mla MlaB component